MTSEAHEISGQWWLPSNPEEKWLGTLTWKPSEGPRLKVTVQKAFLSLQVPETPRILHGMDEQGSPITLLFPGRPQSRGAAVLSELVFTIGYAVIGIHFPDRDDFQINFLTLHMQHLYKWSSTTGLKLEPLGSLEEIHIRYRQPKEQTFSIEPDLSLDLQWGYSLENGLSEKIIRENHSVAFHSTEGLDFTKCIELINAIRGMLHFAVLEPVYPLEITAEKSDHGQVIGDRFHPYELKIWNSIIREPVESEILSERWVFQFKDVQANFGMFFGRWLKFTRTFGEALSCYFTTIYHRLPHSVAHLCLTQAIEAYHGIKWQSHNQGSFREKVQQLAVASQAHLVGLVDDPVDFATTVQHNRNHYTHYNPRWQQDGRVLSGGNLYRLNEKLRLLFQMCVLTEMEIPQERFVRLRRQIASEIIEYV